MNVDVVAVCRDAALLASMAKLKSGQSIKDVIAWAQEELEGFLR